MDPFVEQYPSLSGFTYVANNPIHKYDPDGKRILVGGSREFQRTALAALQRLTNDKLTMKNGTIYITSLDGARGENKDLKFGTNLIRDLNSKAEGSKTVTLTETFGMNCAPPRSTKDATTEGKGSDTEVQWNPKNTQGGLDVNGGSERPTEIGLGHELVHAQDAAHGTMDVGYSGAVDPDSKGTFLLPNYEIKAREGENRIRKEQGIPLRLEPIR